MNKINERDLTRNFLNRIIKEEIEYQNCITCGCCPCECEVCIDSNELNNQEYIDHSPLQTNQEGVVSQEELYNHFDGNDDGIVTAQEYADHIDYHAAHPETLDKYRELSTASVETIPCRNSYDSCGSYCLSDPESMKSMIQPILTATGATCHTSAMQSVIDVLKCMKECGLL